MSEQAMSPDRLRWIIDKADADGWGQLSTWEETFIEDMVYRLDKYGDDLSISERQAEALERIADKLS